MVKDVFYNCSMERSGSTLLQNILGQNPLIYPSPTSPVFGMAMGVKTGFIQSEPTKALNRDEYLPALSGYLNDGIKGWYSNLTNKPYAIDKSRSWLNEIKFIKAYNPNAKIVCMVRDLRAVISSLEKKNRKNPLIDNNITTYSQGNAGGFSTFSRVRIFFDTYVFATPLEILYDVIHMGDDEHIYFLKYEDLLNNPQKTMDGLYDYLELPKYQHDFNNIQQITYENDNVYNSFGDHKIKPKLEKLNEDFYQVLGYDACNYIVENTQWFYQYFNYKI